MNEYVIAPAEPDERMYNAGQGYIDFGGWRADVVFRAMLAAAPDPLDDAELVERAERVFRTQVTRIVAQGLEPSLRHMAYRYYRAHDIPHDEAERYAGRIIYENARAVITAIKGE